MANQLARRLPFFDRRRPEPGWWWLRLSPRGPWLHFGKNLRFHHGRGIPLGRGWRVFAVPMAPAPKQGARA